jgi:hypothetical protein
MRNPTSNSIFKSGAKMEKKSDLSPIVNGRWSPGTENGAFNNLLAVEHNFGYIIMDNFFTSSQDKSSSSCLLNIRQD